MVYVPTSFCYSREETSIISQRRIEEIRNFKDTDFLGTSILTDDQLSQMKACHLVNKQKHPCEDDNVTANIESVLLDTL